MPEQQESISILGLMSGSSLDGLDLAFCTFTPGEESLNWTIEQAATIPFTENWVNRLRKLPAGNAYELAKAHADFGNYLGELVSSFLTPFHLQPDLIASHGHTIFHSPAQQFTFQLGDGAAIAAYTGYAVADNFRLQDVILGGQGAPITPIVDKMIFPEYDVLLNLGGIANLSCKTPRGYVAFDLTGANQVLNHLVKPLGLSYDQDGRLAAQGQLLPELLDEVEQLPFFDQPYPKSLGNDWVQDQLIPIFEEADGTLSDKLYTACYHVADQVVRGIRNCQENESITKSNIRILTSGGGTFNHFLIDLIRASLKQLDNATLEIPDHRTIVFKEALLMALMGYLRLKGIANCLPTSTGASRATIGGGLHFGWKAKKL